ncbi:MAG: hypothetical protein Athens071425_554 [Parcubacteria group bacterium Athens0714_25]|nr:MAG: hypothetical protein Athens071425_554 [Parcubacteria group bacterium Athens0714_25]
MSKLFLFLTVFFLTVNLLAFLVMLLDGENFRRDAIFFGDSFWKRRSLCRNVRLSPQKSKMVFFDRHSTTDSPKLRILVFFLYFL